MTVKILQIGLGLRGAHWAQFVSEHPDFEAVGFVDTDRTALERLGDAGGTGAARYARLDEALADCEADAALVATPSRFHSEHAIRALRAGLAVMVEKPFSAGVSEAKDVLRAAEEVRRPVVVAQNYRYWPAERTVRRHLQDGLIGQLESATLVDRRHMPSHTEGRWMAEIEYPQLQEIAVHHFDSLRCLFDREPISISAITWNPASSDYRHGACTEAFLDFNGVQVQYFGTLTSHRFSFSLWVEGDGGVVWTNRKRVLWRPASSRFFRPLKLDKVPPGDGSSYPRGGTTSLLNSLRDAVTKGTVAETAAEADIWNVATVEAGKRSDRERRAVSINEVFVGIRSTESGSAN